MIMLEEGEIDEEDLDLAQDAPETQPSLDEQHHHHHHHHVKSTKTGGVKRNKNKGLPNGKPTNKRNKKSQSPVEPQGDADNSGGDSADSDVHLDRDERFLPATVSLWSDPVSKSLSGPVSLLDLIAKSDSSSLTNPVLTEKENKPRTTMAKIPGLFSNDLTTGGAMPSLMGSAITNKKQHEADLKRKILNSEPDESEMTISVESLEKKMEKKRKYAELFKEKQAKELEKPEQQQQSNIGKVPCHFFLEGRCAKGDKCPFAHVPQRKMELCKYYGGGYCAKGDKCFYMHADFPCKFYHRMNKCMHGEKCRFSHEPITSPQLREAFEKYLAQETTPNGDQVASATGGSNGSAMMMMTKTTSLLGSPPHHLAAATPVTGGESIPSLMNLAVKPQQPTKTPLIATPPTHTSLLPLPQTSLIETNFLPNKNSNIPSKTNDNDPLRVMSEFRDVDERVAPVPRVPTMPLSGDIDERSLISKPAPVTVAVPVVAASQSNSHHHETIKKELIKLIMKALADDDGGIFSKIPKQPLTELLIKILNTSDANNELSTDTLLTLLTTLTAASSSTGSSTPVQCQPLLQSQLSYTNEENSQLTINLNDSTPDLLQIDLNSSRANSSTVPVKQPSHCSKPLKINSDYEDDYEYDEYDEVDLIIEGNVGEFPFRLIEIDIEPSRLWSNPPREPVGLAADSGDQECDPRIKYYSNRSNCTNVANFHLQLQQKEQQLSFNNTPLSPTSQLQQKQLDTTASSPVNHSGTNGDSTSTVKSQSKTATRSLDPRLVSRGNTGNNISPTRSTSPPSDLTSLQGKPATSGSSLLSSLPEIQFPKNLPLPTASSLFQSTSQTAADSFSTVKLSIEDYKRKLQKPSVTSSNTNGLSGVTFQPEPSTAATLTSSSSSSSLPSIPSYAINLQAPQSLHELLRNFQS